VTLSSGLRVIAASECPVPCYTVVYELLNF
jgi:hypothetical protein